MKKIAFILSIASLSFVNKMNSQSEDNDLRNKLHFGLKAGLNTSNIYDKNGNDFVAGSNVGFAGGAFLALPLGKWIGLHPEVMYSQKGFKATGSISSESYDYTRRTDFLDIPLLFEFKPSEFVSLLAGPSYSYMLYKTETFGIGGIGTDIQNTIANNNIRKNVLGAVVGFDINIKYIVVSARGGWDIMDNNGDGTSTSPSYKNMLLQATIGFRF